MYTIIYDVYWMNPDRTFGKVLAKVNDFEKASALSDSIENSYVKDSKGEVVHWNVDLPF